MERPRHLGPEYAAQFRERDVVQAYAARPPYPAQVFEALRELLPDEGGRVLELGCGTGDLTFGLAPLVRELVAIDPSPAMLAMATQRYAQVPAHVRFVLASAEEFEPRDEFSLLVAAESLHWMDWQRVLPRLKRRLTPDGLLAIVDARQYTDLPWARDLLPLLAAFSTNREYQPYDLIALLTERALFSERGRRLATEVGVRQDLAAYVESFHSRNGFSRARMGESAARFDEAVRELVLRHRPDGVVEGTIAVSVVWGEIREP